MSPAGTEQYDYDPHGRRTLTRRPDGTVTVDYYSRDGLVRGRADTALGGTRVYIHLGNKLVAEDARAWRRSFGIRYLHTDVTGTPIAKTDEAGSVIANRGSEYLFLSDALGQPTRAENYAPKAWTPTDFAKLQDTHRPLRRAVRRSEQPGDRVLLRSSSAP